jgi:hypothetical protein
LLQKLAIEKEKMRMHQIRIRNITRFKREYPQFRSLTNKHITLIFRMYKQNCDRTFFASNVSFLMAGTLIILITSLFINAGASMEISKKDKEPN